MKFFEPAQLLRERIADNQVWAITSLTGAEHSEVLKQFNVINAELVSFRHAFKTRSNTSDFYYQQRYNSFDSDDAPTVSEYLESRDANPAIWSREKVIETFNLGYLLDEEVIKLSNGETKRTLIAAALLHNPEWLLLDHPMSGLDASTRNQVSAILETIARSGIRVVMAVPPHAIPNAVTHVALIENGKLIEHHLKADFEKIYADYKRPVEIDTDLLERLLSYRKHASFETIVSMKDVTIKYADRVILNNINWTVKQGEKWVLSGANGAGKSTLLSLITGDHPQAYANDIILFDKKRGTGESIWDIKKLTGFVSPELFQYFPTYSSCLHVVESGFFDTMGLFRQSTEQLEEICLQWLKLFHIEKAAHQLFSNVSPDVQRLCLLARALVKNPTLLVLDEPTQGLTESQQQFFKNIIEEIARLDSSTIIYVSHYRDHIPLGMKLELGL